MYLSTPSALCFYKDYHRLIKKFPVSQPCRSQAALKEKGEPDPQPGGIKGRLNSRTLTSCSDNLTIVPYGARLLNQQVEKFLWDKHPPEVAHLGRDEQPDECSEGRDK